MKILTTILLILVSQQALAHSRWIIPSHTILSGDKPEYVSFDFSISNDIFHPDNAYGGMPLSHLTKKAHAHSKDEGHKGKKGGDKHKPNPRREAMMKMMASTKFVVQTPDGQKDDSMPIVNLGRKSASAYQFTQSGTYRISIEQNPIYFVGFKNSDGSPGRMFGKLSDNKSKIPQDATNVSGTKLVNRVETFVTRNENTKETLKPIGNGLELIFDTHPNDLFVGEATSATLLFDGKPAKNGTELKVTLGGTRYRNDRDVQKLKTDKDGKIMFNWPHSGIYLIETESDREVNEDDFQKEVFALYLTLEVNPE